MSGIHTCAEGHFYACMHQQPGIRICFCAHVQTNVNSSNSLLFAASVAFLDDFDFFLGLLYWLMPKEESNERTREQSKQ